MLRVGMVHARPGMKLAFPIYHPDRPDRVLLEPGVQLEERVIIRLRELNVREFWIHYPQTDYVSRYVSPEIFEARAALTSQIAQAFDEVSARAQARLNYSSYHRAIKSLMSKLMQDRQAAVFVDEMGDRNRPMLLHASNVCFTSVIMGLRLESYIVSQRSRLSAGSAKDVSTLGVGAMLHDIGMLRLESDVRDRWSESGDESDPEWRRHVELGYELVRGEVSPAASATVLHHHQHFDGSGFPERDGLCARESLAGEDIHVFARIVATADLFDRLRNTDEPGSVSAPIVRVLNQMQQKPYADRIDPCCFKALMSVAPPYAPGTIVVLNNDVQGVVKEWRQGDPCRPVVMQIDNLADPEHASTTPELFDLAQETDLIIVEAEGQDVSKDNFFAEDEAQFRIDPPGKTQVQIGSTPAA